MTFLSNGDIITVTTKIGVKNMKKLNTIKNVD